MIMEKLKIIEIKNIPIILTCPAYFHDLQRSQLKRSAELAGFEIIKLINEPTAAAIFYINKLSWLFCSFFSNSHNSLQLLYNKKKKYLYLIIYSIWNLAVNSFYICGTKN